MARPESDYSMLQRAKQRFVNLVRGTPIPPKDTEGIATLALFDKDGNCEEVVGCIVRNNDKLVQLINYNPKNLYVQKYKKTKYFAYFKNVPHLDYRSAVITFNNSTQSPNEIITCKVNDLVAEEKIVKEGDCHAFVPCDSPDFNNSTFLRHYSKNVNIDQELGPSLTAVEDKKFYGLGKDKEELICLELKRDEQTNNIFIIDSDVYDKLVGGPLFLDDKTTVVGCCTKNEEQRGITIHVFGKKEPIEAWKTSLNYDQLALAAESSGGSTSSKISNQEMKDKFNPLFNEIKPPPLDERSKNSGSDDDCTVDDVTTTGGKNMYKDGEVGDGGASVSDDDDAKDASCDKEDDLYLVDLPESALKTHESSLDSQESREPASNNYENSQRRVPIERGISTADFQSISNGVRVHTEEEGTRPGTGMIPQSLIQVTLGKLCQKDSTVIQDVSLVFDKKKKEHRNVLALADRVDAHPVIKSKCNSNYDHSPASELFNLPRISMLNVREIADSLRSMQRVNLAETIEEKVSESDMLKEVEVVLLNDYRYHDLFEEVTTTLDESGSFRNWRHLGKQLKIEDHILEHIETNTNPAERFLVDYAYIALIPQKLKLSQLYQHMTTLGREDEISILFRKCGITKDDPRSMKVVFQPNSNAMEGLCQLLNFKSPCKGWQNLAHLWDVPPEKYFYYIPDTTASATRILLEWLMMAHPEFTVFELLEHLYELERHDVYEVLEKKLLEACAAPNGTIAI